jgi:ubiquinone biosynthesis protein UbiJ
VPLRGAASRNEESWLAIRQAISISPGDLRLSRFARNVTKLRDKVARLNEARTRVAFE